MRSGSRHQEEFSTAPYVKLPLLSAGVVLVASLGIATHPWATLAVAVFVVLVGYFFLKPAALVYCTVFTAITTLPDFIPTSFSVAGSSVRAYEPLLILSAIFALTKIRARRGTDWRVGLLFSLFVIWSMLGLAMGNPILRIISDVKIPMYLVLAYLVASRVFGTYLVHGVVRILRVSLWISAGVTFLSSAFGISIAGREADSTLNLAGTGEEAVRLLSSATYPALAVVCGAVALAVAGRATLRSSLSICVPALLIVVVSFSRNNILGIAVAIIYGLIAARNTQIIQRGLSYLSGFIAVLGCIVLTSLALRDGPIGAWLYQQIEAFKGRVLGGLTAEGLAKDGSAQFRFEQEDAYLIPDILDSPFWGHGFGYAYKPAFTGRHNVSEDFQYYAHNFYLWLLVKAGIIGFAIIFATFFLPVIRALRSSDTGTLACGAAAASLLACSIVAPMPLGSPTAVLLGSLIGVCAAQTGLRRIGQKCVNHYSVL